MGMPTSRRSVSRSRRTCVWWRATTSIRCTVSSVAIRMGRMKTCATYIRDSKEWSPGNGAPQMSIPRLAPIPGTDSAVP